MQEFYWNRKAEIISVERDQDVPDGLYMHHNPSWRGIGHSNHLGSIFPTGYVPPRPRSSFGDPPSTSRPGPTLEPSVPLEDNSSTKNKKKRKRRGGKKKKDQKKEWDITLQFYIILAVVFYSSLMLNLVLGNNNTTIIVSAVVILVFLLGAIIFQSLMSRK